MKKKKIKEKSWVEINSKIEWMNELKVKNVSQYLIKRVILEKEEINFELFDA